MVVWLALFACSRVEPEPAPELVAGAPVAGAAEDTLDLPVGTPLGGYSARAQYLGSIGRQDNRQSPYAKGFVETTGIHTRAGLRAIWLENGDQDLVLLQSDTIYSFDGLVEAVTNELEKRTGRELTGKVAHTTNHSHHSYGPFSDQVHFYLGGDKYNEEIFRRFVDELVDVAMRAYDTREAAAIGTGWAMDWDPDDRIYRDRRGDNDEVVMFDDLPPGGHGKDPYLNILRVDTVGGDPIALAFTFGVHGVVLDDYNSLVSGDATEGIVTALQEEFDRPVVIMPMQAAGGDASPAGVDREHAKIESLGLLARDPIMNLYEATPTSAEPITIESAGRHIWQHRDMIHVRRDGTQDWIYKEFEPDFLPDEQVYGDAGEILSPIDEFNAEFGAVFCGDDTPLIPAGYIGSNTYPYSSCTDVGLITAILKGIFDLTDAEIPMPLPESMKAGTLAARVGPIPTLRPDGTEVTEDLYAAFFPAEPTSMFVEQARRRMRSRLGFEYPLIVGYSQDHEGYFLPPEDWLAGGYEPNINIWGPLQAEHVMEGVLDYSEELLLTRDVKEDPDPDGYYAPTVYPDRALPTEFVPDESPDAGTLVTELPEYFWVPEPIVADVTPQPTVPRLQGVVQLAWIGGDPMVDLPRVVLERQEGDAWVEVTTGSGRAVTDTYTDILTGWTPEPLYPASGQQVHRWWAGWQAVGHMDDRLALPLGTYRLKVDGQKYVGGSTTWPWNTEPYTVAGEPFEIVPANITVSTDATGLWLSYDVAPEHWRLVDLEGSSEGANPVRGTVHVEITTSTGFSGVNVTPDQIAGGRSHLPLDLTDVTAITVTDEHGNIGEIALGSAE